MSEETLKAPFPYFGGKRKVADSLSPLRWICVPRSTHEGPVVQSFLFRISRSQICGHVAFLASALQAIRCAFVFVEFRLLLCIPAVVAAFCFARQLVTIFVASVFRWAIPAQVRKPVVCFGSVWIMAALLMVSSRPNKRLQNQPMHTPSKDLSLDVQIHREVAAPVTMTLKPSRLSNSSGSPVVAAFSLECPNRSVVTNQVVFKSNHRPQISFNHLPGSHTPPFPGRPRTGSRKWRRAAGWTSIIGT